MWENYYPEELCHHGIKGMKWGVRRFQNKDGSLTPAGKKRYGDDGETLLSTKPKKVKVTHRDVLEKKYRDSGMSEQEAKVAAAKRIKIETAIAITAGATVAACAAYYAKNKWTQTHCDQILKAGTTFHNLDAIANPRVGEHLYVNYRKNDIDYFRGKFALGKLRKTGHVFDHSLILNDDIKIPAINTRKSVFKELYDKDVDFRIAFNKHSGDNPAMFDNKKAYKNMWRLFGDKDDPQFNEAKHKYFEALRQKGYDAIVDEWDTNPRVYRADAPLILLNTSAKPFGEMTIKELSGKDILLAQANSRRYELPRGIKNMFSLPHNNHFTETAKTLMKEKSKSDANSKYIDLALRKRAEWLVSKGVDKDIFGTELDMAKNRKGANLADIGKLLSKSPDMDWELANNIIDAKDGAKALGTLVGMSTAMTLPIAAIQKADQSRYIRKYMSENPDTKLSYKQIEQMSKYNERVRKYIEEHPNTELSTAEILKIYYGLK